MSQKDQSRLDKTIKRAGVVIGRKQESEDIVSYVRSISDKQTEDNVETLALRPEFQNGHIGRSDRFRIPQSTTTRYLQLLFQRPFGHTINKQADKQNTQRPEMGVWGR